MFFDIEMSIKSLNANAVPPVGRLSKTLVPVELPRIVGTDKDGTWTNEIVESLYLCETSRKPF